MQCTCSGTMETIRHCMKIKATNTIITCWANWTMMCGHAMMSACFSTVNSHISLQHAFPMYTGVHYMATAWQFWDLTRDFYQFANNLNHYGKHFIHWTQATNLSVLWTTYWYHNSCMVHWIQGTSTHNTHVAQRELIQTQISIKIIVQVRDRASWRHGWQ